MAKYSDEFRAECIALLVAEGYPEGKGAVQAVRKKLLKEGVSPLPAARTMRYWYQQKHNPAPEKVIRDKKDDLADLFERAARNYVHQALKPDVIEKASAGSAMTAAAIAVDKMRLLRDLPTEIVQVLPIVMDAYHAIVAIGENPEVVFGKLVVAAEKRKKEVMSAED